MGVRRKETIPRDSGIREIFAGEIWNPGHWNSEYSSRNPESLLRSESGIKVPLTKIPENPVPRIRRTKSTALKAFSDDV